MFTTTTANTTSVGGSTRFAAHEFLETQEAVRTKGANIELYGVLISMAQDSRLKETLFNQQKKMIEGYNYAVQLLQGKGVQVKPHALNLAVFDQPQVGLQQPTIPAPNPGVTQLSDLSISTIALNLHKSGAAIAMLWANECVDAQIRTFHVTSANICQEMSWELFQYMNARGYYQAPQLADHTMRSMLQGISTAGQQTAYSTYQS